MKTTQWKLVALVFGAGVMASFQIGKAPPMLPEIRAELSLSLFAAGWLLAIFNALGLFVSPLIGSIADWLGHRRAVMIGLSLLCIGSFAGSFAYTGSTLLAARLVEGSGYLVTVVSAPALLMRVSAPQNVRTVFGIWGAFMPTGGALMMLASPFVANVFGWRGLWQMNSFLLVCYLVMFGFVTRTVFSSERGKFSFGLIHRNVVEVIKSGTPVLFALSFMAYALMFLALIGFLPTLFIEDAGLSRTVAAMLSACVLAMNIIGNLAGGMMLTRGVNRWKMVFFAVLGMGITAFAVYDSSLPVAVRTICAGLFTGIGGMLPATAFDGASHYAPRRELVGTSTGILLQGTQAGLLIGPPVVAKTVSAFGGWHAAPYAYALFTGIGLLVALLIRRVEQKEFQNRG